MTGLVQLDALVKKEITQMQPVPGLQVQFHTYDSQPGKGTFDIKGSFNDAQFAYSVCPHLGTRLALDKNGHKVQVTHNHNRIDAVQVNDERYYHPESALCDNADDPLVRPDIDRAIEFGGRAYSSVREHLDLQQPGLLKLIARYYDRTLLPADDRPSMSSCEEIFAQFDLRVKK